MNTVSIIVPVYKVEQYLSRCVDSIIKQTYKDIEVILVDDGSPDNSGKMCDYLALTDARIKVIHKENGGLSSARLTGFKAATGKYIQFVDSDDYIEHTMTEKLVRGMEKQKADLCFCGYNTIHGSQSTRSLLPYQEESIKGSQNILQQYVLPLFGHGGQGEISIPGFTCVRLYRKDLLEDAHFQSERKFYLEDHILNLMYVKKVHTIAIVNEPLYNYCVNFASLSNCYRKNKWQMYCNIFGWYDVYIKDNGIKGADSRLYNFKMSALCATVDNAVNIGSYSGFREEIMPLYNDSIFKRTIKQASFRFKLDTQSLTINLLKLHMLKPLYKFRYNRINKAKQQ